MKIFKLTSSTLVLALLMIILMLPMPIMAYVVINSEVYEEVTATSSDDTAGQLPGVSTMVDAHGNTLATFFEQNRVEVPSDAINKSVKEALVAIEDRRFYEHKGVDPMGVARALVTNLQSGGIEQGSSTLEMQFVKNYHWLISADTEEEQATATEQSFMRKLKEMHVSLDLNSEFTKDEILTKYLNLVSFGNQAYGIQVAAQTYFGVNAADLTTPQSALLAGLVQAPSMHDPYNNPESALTRRNDVLYAMMDTGKITEAQHKEFTESPLGILPEPATLSHGCYSAGNSGFFCDYALKQVQDRGLPMEEILEGGYRIQTTLDPVVQASAKEAVNAQADPQAPGAAQVLNFIAPGAERHPILAMATNRDYGLNEELHQTTQPLMSSMVGAGSGSVAKVFTAAAALETGTSASANLQTPARYEASGMGTGGAAGCPPTKWCVENAGTYPKSMSFSEALSQSPNTTFVMLQEKVGIPRVVDMAVRLGLRSYALPGTAGGDDPRSLAQATIEESRGSFTLGADAVNPLELANVGATLASGGTWCEPEAVTEVFNRDGHQVALEPLPCDQAVEPGLANTLTNAMSKDTISGTAQAAAGITGWSLPMAAKTGTSEGSGSAAFLGYTNTLAGISYAFDDSATPGPLCTSPLRSCASGNVFGGMEPGRAWMNAAIPVAGNWGPVSLPPADPRYM